MQGMTTLKTVHLGNLISVMPQTVKLLNLEHCTLLRHLPVLSGLPMLETLLLTGCSALSNLPEHGWTDLLKIKKIDLFGCELLAKDDVAAIVHGLRKEQHDALMLIMPGGDVWMGQSSV